MAKPSDFRSENCGFESRCPCGAIGEYGHAAALSTRRLSPETLCSMNLFGLTVETLQRLELQLQEFRQKNASNRIIECLLPQEIGNLIKEKAITMNLLRTDDQWHGLTHPQDEEQVRNELIKMKLPTDPEGRGIAIK